MTLNTFYNGKLWLPRVINKENIGQEINELHLYSFVGISRILWHRKLLSAYDLRSHFSFHVAKDQNSEVKPCFSLSSVV